MEINTPPSPVTRHPYTVKIQKGEFTDPARENRIIPYKIYHPTEHDLKTMPTIIWSHGFGGNANGAAFLSRFLAGQGYTLIHITHHGTDSSLWEGKEGHPWDILRKVKIDRETTIHRFRDVPFVLDQLPAWITENPDVGQYMNIQNIGMSGHSFGAMTTQVMAGQHFPDASGNLIRMYEPRFKAGILYSPVPIRHLVDEHITNDDLYGAIDLPLLHMTGTKDDSPLEGHTYKHRLAVHDHSGHDEKYLLIKEDGDHMVYNGTRGKLGNTDLREQHEEQIKTAALAFWDAYLKDDKNALDFIRSSFIS
ncbi:MAG: alpha/beta hydrolase family protein [Alphaproteobacteria bacterium]